MSKVSPAWNRSRLTRLWVSLWLFLAIATGPAESAEPVARDLARALAAPSTPSLTLVWNDGHRQGPSSLEVIRDEIERIFAPLGIAVWLERAGDEVRHAARDVSVGIRVILMPVEPESWGLKGDVLGVTVGDPGAKKSIFIFVPGVRRALGPEVSTADRSLRLQHELARALGRITAHEVVHALAPSQPHAPHGIMRDRLTRAFLVRQGLELDRRSAEVLLEALGSRALRAALSPSTLPVDAAGEAVSGLAATCPLEECRWLAEKPLDDGCSNSGV